MDISVKSLNIVYKFSTHGARDPYLTLSSIINWVGLIQKASDSVEHLKKKKNPKPFKVHVKDFSVTQNPRVRRVARVEPERRLVLGKQRGRVSSGEGV